MAAINVNSSCSIKFIIFLTFVVFNKETFNFYFVVVVGSEKNPNV